jgi:DNA-binding NarL/FixJ family response regulator
MGVSVLIVDDHPGFRALARSLLEAEGYLVVGEAGDGGSAVTAAVALKPQLVLLDIQLPDRDGFEVARQLLQQAPHRQVVLISSRAACDYGHHVDQCGARGFITKDELCGATLAELLLVAE